MQPASEKELADTGDGLAQTGAALNRLITAKDHSSVQINVADVDESGRAIPGQNTTFAFCGAVRSLAESDDSLNRVATEAGCQCCKPYLNGTTLQADMAPLAAVLKNVWSYSR